MNQGESGLAPQTVRSRIEEGYRLLRQGRSDAAVGLADDLLAEHPSQVDALVFASDARLAADDAETALERIESAVALSPEDLQLLQRKAQVLMGLMRRRDARAVAAEISRVGAGDPNALWMAGRIHSRCDDPAGAAAFFQQALQHGCTDPSLLNDLAAVQFFLGEFDQAERNLDTFLARTGSRGQALYLRSTVRRQTSERNHVADLEARLKARPRQADDAAGCLYALAKELEDLERWDDACSALQHGARVKRGTLRYDVATEVTALDGIATTYGADAMHQSSGAHAPGDPAIFIVGMPRTGTTLVERILGRHPNAVSVGELPYFAGALATATGRRMRETGIANGIEASLDIDHGALGRRYLDGARQAALEEGATIDKMPVNFMYCGLIRKALPGARLVHLVRDPMDTCFAVYKTLFKQAYSFSYDFGELAAYYAAYRRLMRHWHAVMPGEILDVRYEDLVTDTGNESRRLLDWCGLPWDPCVLSVEDDRRPSTTASAAQVRGPVHAASIGRWRRFGKGLLPLRAALAEQGIEAS